jgi:hypothetical protein
MKHIAASILCTLTLTAWAQQPPLPPDADAFVYDPGLKLADEPTMNQIAAVNFLLGNHDEAIFIKGYVPQGMTKKADDEFGGGGDNSEITKANRESLEYAHRLLNGEIDYPLRIDVRLRRYNSANQTFLTNATAPAVDIDITPRHGWPALPNGSTSQVLCSIQIDHWFRFSGIQLPPVQAKKLTEISGTGRLVSFVMNCRIIPNTLGNVGDYNFRLFRTKTTVRNIKIVGPDGTLPDEMSASIKIIPYPRTEADLDFEKRMLHRAWVSVNDTIIFEVDGWFYFGDSLNRFGTPQEKVECVANMPSGRWYIIGGKLFWQRGQNGGQYDDKISEFEFEPNGIFRVDAVPYTEEKHLTLDGKHISWKY